METAYRAKQVMLNYSRTGLTGVRTFGLPVVPLEKLRNATFVLPSPGRSFRSTYAFSARSPRSTNAPRESPAPGLPSTRMIRSGRKPASRAAARAVPAKAAWAMMSEDLLAVSWYASSGAVYEGFAQLCAGVGSAWSGAAERDKRTRRQRRAGARPRLRCRSLDERGCVSAVGERDA